MLDGYESNDHPMEGGNIHYFPKSYLSNKPLLLIDTRGLGDVHGNDDSYTVL